jgi:hypothetical protein
MPAGKGCNLSGSVLAPCSCSHPFQDARYGKGIRVMTKGGTTGAPKMSCTVCGNTRMLDRAK